MAQTGILAMDKPVQKDPKFEANFGFLVGYCLKTELHTG